MPSGQAKPLPRKFTIYLLRLYIVMGIISLLAGGYLGLTAYQMRVATHMRGTVYVMIVAGVVAAFGLWRCVLASYHLWRLARAQKRP